MGYRYLVRRAAHSAITLFLVSVVVFLLLRITPADPALVILGETATPESLARLRAAMGLDQSLLVQYVRYVGSALQGDFGESIRARRPVVPYVMDHFPATLELAGAALFLAVLVGLAVGILSAVKRDTFYDQGAMFVALVGQSVPGFWLGLMLIAFFAVQLHLLPASGRGDLVHLLMPAVTLSVYLVGLIIRLTRSTMLDVLAQDYIRTARAKGLIERVVVARHALKNALIPVVTVLGLQVGALLGGAVITETVFAWPGMGRLAVLAIQQRDYPVVQFTVLLSAVIFTVVNFLVDLGYYYLDPRMSRQ